MVTISLNWNPVGPSKMASWWDSLFPEIIHRPSWVTNRFDDPTVIAIPIQLIW
jgi:hypothetical protein